MYQEVAQNYLIDKKYRSKIKNQLLGTDIPNENLNILYQSIFNDVELVNSNIKTMLSESALPYKAVQKDELITISTIIESRENLDNNSMQNNSNIESFESEVPKSINSENVNF